MATVYYAKLKEGIPSFYDSKNDQKNTFEMIHIFQQLNEINLHGIHDFLEQAALPLGIICSCSTLD